MYDPRLDSEYIVLYLLTCDGAGGLLDRVQKRLGSVTRAIWRDDIRAAMEHAKRALEQDVVEAESLLPLIRVLQKKTGTLCDHHFREIDGSDSYTGDRARECDKCKLVVTSDVVPDSRCLRCGVPLWRKGTKGPALEYCSEGCRIYMKRNQ